MTQPRSPALTDECGVSLRDDLSFALYVAARAWAGHYRPFLAELGLTYPQFLVMQVLWSRGQVTVKDLGGELGLDSGTLSPLLKRLEGAELVDRHRSASDGRQVQVSSTESGRAVRDRASRVVESAQQARRYPPEQYDALIPALHALTGRLRAGTPPG
ncbi:MarR family winged helix-turn-helix transcriptional regulator [Streptomyces sp. NPDC058611]|uniref:MarR family winged helix-turn-helix transcriptional regulator n=1 Tax=unclassified Streptomyces TaxID=2593676 RepID=UPI003651FA6D